MPHAQRRQRPDPRPPGRKVAQLDGVAKTPAAALGLAGNRAAVAAPRAGSFSQVVSGLGPQAVDVERLALLNGTVPDQTVNAGELLKTVTPGRRR